ncbi:MULTISPECIES: hypothetical protein [Sellimonas]|uniref:Uncharacterized protein n=1 Tax=Sellimonas caecigallum TaxID=2592333 RepID=A0ABS7L587_9FIRM|nr:MULTISPECIES: hypothetical protein [Sellimonas]MBY0758201.1 hypothetical protein [Sellimonas caecigallum]OUP01282.1 hypothetical protein B5F37_08200 [Drancourtella sp. An210]OUP67047.1 hypothetical protein B5F13_01480 [Drancourtella sp. An177]
MAFVSYQKVTGIIQNIRNGSSCCTLIVSIMTQNGTVNMAVSQDTMVVDCVRLRPGMRVAAFYDSNLPVPAIYPPQYQAEIITLLRRNQEVTLRYFDETLTAEDNSLRLNISPGTNIETINGQRFLCDPGNSDLLVYYTATTFSIPPQTSPQRIIVVCPAQ